MPTNPPSPTAWLQQQRKAASAAPPPREPVCSNAEALDSTVERFLQLHGVKYAPKTMIPVAAIDEKASLSNQARREALVPDSLERFMLSLRQGEYLPPIITFPQGQRLEIIDGNNRFVTHKRFGSTHIPGFVIDEETPSATIALLKVAANNGHGATPDLAWRRSQAAMLTTFGYSQDDACTAAGIKVRQLQDYLAMQRADGRAKQTGVGSGWAKLSDTARIALGRGLNLDSVFVALARCVIEAGIDTEATRVLISETRKFTSEADQLAHVQKVYEQYEYERKQRAATGNRNRVSSPNLAFSTGLGKVVKADPAVVAGGILAEHDATLIISRCYQAAEILMAVTTELEKKFGHAVNTGVHVAR